jgi:DNA-binding winged helix-turn-helix (wHTH) protein/predicted negative regulator of RcsB-dependent stress response
MDAVPQDRAIRVGKWLVEPMLNRISCMDEIVRIEPQNIKLLLRLAARPGAVISLEEIERDVWHGLVVTPNSVYQSVAQLRRALGDDKAKPTYIETVPRKGYRLVAPVSLEATTPSGEEAPEPELPINVQAESGTWGMPQRLVRASSIALSVATALSLAIYLNRTGESDSTATRTRNAPLSRGSREQPKEAPLASQTMPVPNNQATGAPSVVELDKSALRLDPEAQAQMYVHQGDSALRHGDQGQARMHFEKALAMQIQRSGRDDVEVAIILTRLANSYLWSSNYATAEETSREAVRIFEQKAPALHPDLPRAHAVLADILLGAGRYEEAGIHAERSFELARLLYGDSSNRTIDAEISLAQLRLAQGRLDEAEAWARRVLKDYTPEKHGTDFGSVTQRTLLASVLYKKKRYVDAAAEITNALEILERAGLPDHPYVASAQHILGESLIKLGKCDEAERALLIELRVLKNTESELWRIARATSALGEALLGQGRIREAEAQLMGATRDLEGAKGWMENDARLATEERMQRLRQSRTAMPVAETSRSCRSN